jgi:prepilin signal peptidase PulO-like enzyme (type II secretory pathway)
LQVGVFQLFRFFGYIFPPPHPDLVSALIRSILGILAGGGSLFLVAWTYERLTGKEGMGMGDVKLQEMIGVLLGWQGVLFTIMVYQPEYKDCFSIREKILSFLHARLDASFRILFPL